MRALRTIGRLALCVFLPLLLSSCAHSIHQVYVSSMDQGTTYGSSRWVVAEAKDFVILGFELDTNYIELAYQRLEDKCKGRLSQVSSEHLTSYFLLSYDQRLILKGLCTRG